MCYNCFEPNWNVKNLMSCFRTSGQKPHLVTCGIMTFGAANSAAIPVISRIDHWLSWLSGETCHLAPGLKFFNTYWLDWFWGGGNKKRERGGKGETQRVWRELAAFPDTDYLNLKLSFNFQIVSFSKYVLFWLFVFPFINYILFTWY